MDEENHPAGNRTTRPKTTRPKTTRPIDNSPQDNLPEEKLALRQLVPDSEDNSAHFVSLNSTFNAQLHVND